MIVITGQTATGKTDLALKYAKKYNGELINFDSRQIYKFLDIITGKDLPAKTGVESLGIPTARSGGEFFDRAPAGEDTRQAPSFVWLYDVITPDQYFSSFEFVKLAQKTIEEIEKRGNTPILVGGSYFYLKHLLYGFDYKVPPNFKLREELNKKTVKELQQNLNSLNPLIPPTMNQSDWNNPRRLIRKIEIRMNIKTGVEGLGIPTARSGGAIYRPSTGGKRHETGPVIIGLHYKNKDKLRMAIKERVEKRLAQGAIEEVKNLFKKGYKKSDPGLKTIGYKQIIEHLNGRISKEQAIEKWINAEVQYAKRQYTFMKKDPSIKWREI